MVCGAMVSIPPACRTIGAFLATEGLRRFSKPLHPRPILGCARMAPLLTSLLLRSLASSRSASASASIVLPLLLASCDIRGILGLGARIAPVFLLATIPANDKRNMLCIHVLLASSAKRVILIHGLVHDLFDNVQSITL